jgi:hypothetical protein
VRAASFATIPTKRKTPDFILFPIDQTPQLDNQVGQPGLIQIAFENALLNPNPIFLKEFGDSPATAVIGHVVRHHDQMRHQRHPRKET